MTPNKPQHPGSNRSFVSIESESPHSQTPIEWWFVHGNYYSSNNLSGHFMLSVFRHAISDDHETDHGYSLLFCLQDSSQKSPYVVSKADSRVKDLLRRAKEEFSKTNMDVNLCKTYFEEVEKYGLPLPESSADSSASFDNTNFGIQWDDYSLRRQDGFLILEFRVPWIDEKIRFILNSQTPRVNLNMLSSPGKENMAYLTHPNLELQGNYGGSEVSGSAWFDHQWGDMSWFFSEEKSNGQKRLLGWDWLGINLNNGMAAVILVHRDMETKNVIASNLVIIKKDGSIKKVVDFNVEPLRYWYSSKTCISYPIEWKITIPSLNGELTFHPSSDDQEIPIAGATRAIWEGAGRISGTLFAQPVFGTARLELNGYGYVFRLSDVLGGFSRRIYKHIHDFFPEAPDDEFFKKYTGIIPEKGNVKAIREVLNRPMWDLLNRGGKYWRPMFGILMAEVLGLDSRKYEDFMSVTTELIHLASLIIDDIEDGALVRRNEKCIHLKYGTDIAINAANTLYFLPILKLKENLYITEKQALEIYRKAMDFFVKAHIGQGLDLYRSTTTSSPRDWDYASLIHNSLNIYALKSAASVEFITHTACIIADANQATTDALVNFARSFGISFQIKDDVHDFSSAGKWTKNPGEDLACGKLTYVILLALEAVKSNDLTFITDLLRKKIPPSAGNIKKGIRIIRDSGALQKANADIFSRLNDAWEDLSEIVPQSDAKIMLKVMCEHLLKLDYFEITT